MANPFPGGLTVSADGSRIYVADERAAAVSVIDTVSRSFVATVPVGHNPYGVQLTTDGRTAYVSNWGDNTVTVIDTATETVRGTVTVGTHPSAIALNPKTHELYVANSDSDTVSVIDTARSVVTRSINLAPYPNAPVGASPNALAFAPDGKTLYVANAGDDDVAVVRLDGGKDRVAGLIPTAWYPTSVTVTTDGGRLLITNAKGLGAGPNPNGPNPYNWDKEFTPGFASQYVGAMIKGTLSVVNVPNTEQLAKYTDQVRRNNGSDARGRTTKPGLEAVLPRHGGQSQKIKHVIYVLKENRTYDQVLGDLGRGNGDPSLTLFGWPVTPNQHRLAQQFVTLDNFYTSGAVSGDGWQWTAGAYANTHNEKTWPANYGNRYSGTGNDATQVDALGRDPNHSYIWDQVIDAHLTMRDYGWWAQGNSGNVHAQSVNPELDPYINRNFPSFQISTIRDRNNLTEWQREYNQYEATNTLPAFESILLPADHTTYTGVGSFTPKAMVADNDYALGKLVDTVSHSKDWKDTAIFVIEDDAQDGADHVDGHRSIAQVISPYTQTGRVDSSLYTTVSMLRTMEDILGLPPMTQFDAAAAPMLGSFTNKPSFAPYNVVLPQQNMDERNQANAPMAAQASTWDVSKPDAAPAQLGNTAIWQSVKGAGSQPPAPRDHGRPVTAAVRPPTGD
jgi:YVTN family beta-propeller protein